MKNNKYLDHTKSWNPSGLRLLGILEGIPISMSMLDLGLYNYKTLYLMIKLNENPFDGAKDILSYMVRCLPYEINYDTYNFFSYLLTEGYIDSTTLDNVNMLYYNNDKLSIMKETVDPIRTGFFRARDKYSKKGKSYENSLYCNSI
jgi:hypothetical protein